jgi:hypothetical protein
MTERRATSGARTSTFLRNPFAVISTAFASFLIVMVLLTARVMSGADPALRASAPNAVVVSHGGHKVLRTTASGRVIGSSAGRSGGEVGGSPSNHAIVTRSSGGYAPGGEGDG